MEAVAKSVIDRPREAVFEFMDVPENQARISPRLSNVEMIGVLDNGGKRARYTYRLGRTFEGEVRGVVHEPPERIVFELSGDLDGRLEWTFETVDDATRVTYAADYDLGLPPIVGWLLEPIVARYNQRELERTLQNLEDRLSWSSISE